MKKVLKTLPILAVVIALSCTGVLHWRSFQILDSARGTGESLDVPIGDRGVCLFSLVGRLQIMLCSAPSEGSWQRGIRHEYGPEWWPVTPKTMLGFGAYFHNDPYNKRRDLNLSATYIGIESLLAGIGAGFLFIKWRQRRIRLLRGQEKGVLIISEEDVGEKGDSHPYDG